MPDWSSPVLVRDNWEAKKPELESQLSSLLDCPWQVSIDTQSLFPLIEVHYAKEHAGATFTEYTIPYPDVDELR